MAAGSHSSPRTSPPTRTPGRAGPMAAGSHSPTAPLPHHVPQVGQDHEAGDENNDPQHGAGRQDEGLLQGHQPPRQMGPHGDWREIQGLVSNATLLSNLLLLPPAPPPGARPQQHILGPGGGWVGPRPFGCRPGPIFLPGFLIPASGFGGDPPSASPLPPPARTHRPCSNQQLRGESHA